MNVLENLKELGLELPTPSPPGGNYVSVNIRSHIAYIAIQFPILNNQLPKNFSVGLTATFTLDSRP